MITKIINWFYKGLFIFVTLTPLSVFSQGVTSRVCKGLVCCSGPDCNFSDFLYNLRHIISEVLKYSFALIAVVVAIAGYKYMTSHGDTGKIKEAHEMFQKAFIGMLVVMLGFMVIKLLTSTLGWESDVLKLN